jgi:hypothetical protein
VIAKAEWTKGEANPRFIVTSLHTEEVTGQSSWRYGEAHQRVSGRPVRRPHTGSHHARQSVAPMVRLFCLMPDVRTAPRCARRQRVGSRHLRQHPAQAPQDRCSDQDQRTSVKIAVNSSYPGQQLFALAYARLKRLRPETARPRPNPQQTKKLESLATPSRRQRYLHAPEKSRFVRS